MDLLAPLSPTWTRSQRLTTTLGIHLRTQKPLSHIIKYAIFTETKSQALKMLLRLYPTATCFLKATVWQAYTLSKSFRLTRVLC